MSTDTNAADASRGSSASLLAQMSTLSQQSPNEFLAFTVAALLSLESMEHGRTYDSGVDCSPAARALRLSVLRVARSIAESHVSGGGMGRVDRVTD